MSPLAKLLVAKRGARGQRAIAEEIGVTQPAYSGWEQDVIPKGRYHRALRRYLGMSEKDFSIFFIQNVQWKDGVEPFSGDN